MDTQGEGETQPLDSDFNAPVGSVVSDGAPPPTTIECWSCRNTFGVPPGTPQGSILACPMCQNHNRFGQQSGVMGAPIGNPGGGNMTTVVAMPIQSIPLGASNISRAKTLIAHMRCCWCTVVVLGF